jgi:hypothetical protein
MTEAEWLVCTDPTPMLKFLQGKASDRRLRLFGCACCRRVWHLLPEQRSRQAVEVAERYADGTVEVEDVRLAVIGAENAADEAAADAAAAHDSLASAAFAALNVTLGVERAGDYAAANASSAAYHAATAANAPSAAEARAAERAAQARLLRDLFGDPFRLVALHPTLLSWGGGTIPRLAAAIYQERTLPAGTFDNTRLAVLADALEDAGCTDPAILDHLRGPGPHVRGCFVIDIVLSGG